MRPCYCLISGKPGISLRRLVRFQSHSNHVAVYASSKLPNIPLSTRCAFSVLKMWSCWSGRKVKNCWISLLGLGPLIKLAMYTLTKVAIRYWQSKRSMIPPCPGIVLAKSLILKALLNPLAKKPPNGPIREAKVDSAILWIWNGYIRTVFQPTTDCSTKGMLYSCNWNSSDGSQSTVKLLVSLLNSTGQVKHRYPDIT